MSKRRSTATDFELNLAPIIDCFTVLITFMLASASFLSISIFDAGFTPVEAMGDPNPPQITINLNVKDKDRGYELVVKGKENSNATYKTPEEVGQALVALKGRFPAADSVTLSADDNVEYDKVVKAMEKIRPVFPALVLGGF